MVQPYPYPYPQPSRPSRSAIPKVIGILMIIFGSLGLAGSLIGLLGSGLSGASFDGFGGEPSPMLKAMKDMQRFDLIFALIALPISGLQLFGGIACLKYKAGAPKLAVIYSIVTVVHSVAKTIMVKLVLQPAINAAMREFGRDDFGRSMAETTGLFVNLGLLVGVVGVLAWALVVSILMTRPAAKIACVN